jgi:hypothetical protein
MPELPQETRARLEHIKARMVESYSLPIEMRGRLSPAHRAWPCDEIAWMVDTLDTLLAECAQWQEQATLAAADVARLRGRMGALERVAAEGVAV